MRLDDPSGGVSMTWRVQVDSFTWTYEFTKPNKVLWTERNIAGTWKKDTKKLSDGTKVPAIKITWPLSNSIEWWKHPLDSNGTTGWLEIPKQGGYPVMAKPLSFLELGGEEVEVEDLSDYETTFVNACRDAKDIVHDVIIDFHGWLIEFKLEYLPALDKHLDLLKQIAESIDESIKVEAEWIALISSAFLAGVVGSFVGSFLEKAIENEVIVDGIKTLAKEAILKGGEAISEAMIPKVAIKDAPDADPKYLPDWIDDEVFKELSRLTHVIDKWKDYGTGSVRDPVQEVKRSLRMFSSPGHFQSLLELPTIKDSGLKKQLQKAWLQGLVRDQKAHSIIAANRGEMAARERFLAYNEENELQVDNIEALLDEYYPVLVIPGGLAPIFETPD